jgi:hypothetical protein
MEQTAATTRKTSFREHDRHGAGYEDDRAAVGGERGDESDHFA